MEKTIKRDYERIIEIVIVIMLGITALVMAWASWMSSLHGGNQATSYTVSNNLSSEGNSEYNAAVQSQMQDMLLWNDISELQAEWLFATDAEVVDEDEISLIASKILFKMQENLSPEMAEQIQWDMSADFSDPVAYVSEWMDLEAALTSPFFNEDYVDAYYVTANELLEQSHAELENGKKANADGDAFGLVTVIYSVVLFLLGIASSLKSKTNKNIVVAFSLVAFVVAMIYMFTIPLPSGFELVSYFA